VFPVFCSLLSIEAVAALVESQYQLEVTSCQFWHRGNSDVYLLETDHISYIFKIYHHHLRSRQDIGFELQLLTYLKDDNIPVSSPIYTTKGDDHLEIEAPEGLRYGSLFLRAPGTVALGDLNPQQSYILGAALARLHHSGASFQSSFSRPPLDLESILESSTLEITPYLCKEQQAELISTHHDLLNQISNFPKEAPYWTVCWGDPHSGNVHFTVDQSPTLFDFDQCGYGYRLFDIAKFWQVSLQSGLSSSIRSALLSGYQSQHLLSDLELSSLNYFTRIAHIWSWSISLSVAKCYDGCRLDSSFFTRRLQHLKRIASSELYPKL